jgi:uncharacterized protein (DUF952 family)
MREFYHIIDREEWLAAVEAGSYSPESVATEGFIHCSYSEQVLMPANFLFRGRDNLVLLRIDPSRVKAEVRHDPVEMERGGVESVEYFPHIYGPLNPDAVVGIVEFPVSADGTFALPAGLAENMS